MSLAWIRLWADMAADPKFRTIAKKSGQPLVAVIAFYVLLLTNAAQRPFQEEVPPGATSLDDEDAASALDWDVAHIQAIREAMQGRVLEGSVLKGWERRQMPSAVAQAERARAYRARQKQATLALESRVAQVSSAPSADRTPRMHPESFAAAPDKPIKTPKTKKIRSDYMDDILVPLVEGLDMAAWKAWIEWRIIKKDPIPHFRSSVLIQQNKLVRLGANQMKAVENSIGNGWTGVFPVNHTYGAQDEDADKSVHPVTASARAWAESCQDDGDSDDGDNGKVS